MTVTIVGSISDLNTAVAAAATNDTVLLSDGTYTNGAAFGLTTTGTKVLVAAEHPHKAIIQGQPISLNDAGIHFMNFDLRYSLASGSYVDIEDNADNCRISHCKISFGNGTGTQHWLRVLEADNCKIDHNVFDTKTTDGNMLLVGSGNTVNANTKVFANVFQNHTAGGETLRVGASDVAQIDFNCDIYSNRFYNCKADDETVTIKSSNNNFHHNYLEDCHFVSQRHGHSNKYNDNILYKAGLRLSGYGHEVLRNQIIENTHTPPTGHLSILNGSAEDDPGTPGTVQAPHAIYARCKNCTIKNNIIAAGSVTGSAAKFYLGYDTGRTFDPVNNIIKDNIITGATGVLSFQSGSTAGSTTHYNVVAGGDGTANLNSASSLRYGIEAQSGSALVGDSVKTFKCRLRKAGTPTGTVSAVIRRSSDDSVVATFGPSFDASILGLTFADVTFTLDTPYTITTGDKILVEYAGTSTITIELYTTDHFDGSLTRRTRFQNSVYSASNTVDICGLLQSDATGGTGALWANNFLEGNIVWATGSATVGTITGATSTNPQLSQQADHTYAFSETSPLSWQQTAAVIPIGRAGIIRSFI